jgi:hypothetical protein
MASIEVLSPEGPERHVAGRLARRLPGLHGTTVALHDNAKPGAVQLLSAIGEGLVARGARLRRWGKTHAARPTPHVAEMSGAVDAAVFALGD